MTINFFSLSSAYVIDYGSLDKSIPGSFEVGFGALGSWNSGNWAFGNFVI